MHERISAAQVLAGGQPEHTNAFLQLLAQVAVAPGAAAGGPLRDPQLHPHMQTPPRGAPAQPLPAAEAGHAAPASVRESGAGEEARGAPAPGKPRRPESARRGPPPACGQAPAPKQARGPMHALPPLLPPALGLEAGSPWEGAEGMWQGWGAAERRRGAVARSEGPGDEDAGDAVRREPDDLAEASALVRAVGQARVQPCPGVLPWNSSLRWLAAHASCAAALVKLAMHCMPRCLALGCISAAVRAVRMLNACLGKLGACAMSWSCR